MLAGVDPATTPIGPWCDAAWAEYVGFVFSASAAGGQPVTEAVDATWSQLVGDVAPALLPTPGEQGATAQASRQAPRAATPRPGEVPIDPETGQPRRPTKAEREAWALQTAAQNDLTGLMGVGGQSGSAEKVGG